MSADEAVITSDDESSVDPPRAKGKGRATSFRGRPAVTLGQEVGADQSDFLGRDGHNVIVIEDDDEREKLEESVTPERATNLHTDRIPDGHERQEFALTRCDEVIRAGQTVQLEDGAFLRIIRITRDQEYPHNIYVSGDLLQRNRDIDKKKSRHNLDLYSWLPKQKNELCAIVRVSHSAQVPKLGHSLETRHLAEIGAVRDVVFTNTKHDEEVSKAQKRVYRCHQHLKDFTPADIQGCLKCAEHREANGPLTCRRKRVEEVDVRRKKIVGWQLRQLDEDETTPGHTIHRIARLADFRGLDEKDKSDTSLEVPEVGYSSSGKKRRSDRESSSNSRGRGRGSGNLAEQETPQPKRLRETTTQIIDLTLPNPDLEVVTRKKQFKKSSETITSTNPDTGKLEKFTFETEEIIPAALHLKDKGKTQANSPNTPNRRRKVFTYGDVCAGAGGTARGAKMAGLHIKFLLDNMPEACQTLRVNFGNDFVLEMDIGDFCCSDSSYYVDVLHISFPCQAHSSLNRRLNPELDAVRLSMAYGTLGTILDLCKPRLVTMEQVVGIMSNDDGQHLRAQIHSLVCVGYEVRWKTHNLRDHGNAQGRHRLITLAACPGQILPDWPEPSHGPGMKPYVTVRDILDQVRRPAYNREVMQYAVIRQPGERTPYDPNVQLRGCITASGGYRPDKNNNNYNPSGRCDFTYQEKAQLQGFPAYHSFHGGRSEVGIQIGNAVPPVFAEKLFRKCVEALEETDRHIAEYKKPVEVD